MSQNGHNGHKPVMALSMTRERVTGTIINNLIKAGVLLRAEAERYRKVLDTYDENTLLIILIHTHELREAGGDEIITN